MNDWIASLLLGLIEGITEFLPISSTGHLLIAEHWLGARSDLFNIAIQAGAILAVVVIYRHRLLQLAIGWRERDNRDDALKLGLAFVVTAVLGLLVKKLGVQLPETLGPVAWALLIGGVLMLWAERMAARRAGALDEGIAATGDGAPVTAGIGWGAAALVGVAQVVAGVFPGTSRAAAAIFAALLFGGVGRAAATEFAFLVGIPTMFAATGYELLHVLRAGGAAGEDWTGLGVAFVVSALTAFAAVKWLLGYIVTHRFTVFSWYRIVLGAALLASLAVSTPAPAGHASTIDAAPRGAPTNRGAPGSASIAVHRVGSAAALQALPAQDRGADLAQASAAFRALKLCIDAEGARGWVRDPRSRAELDTYIDANIKPEDEPYRRLLLAQVDRQLDAVARAKNECLGVPPGRLVDGSIYPLALRAALLGDRGAAACFLVMNWQMPPSTWRDAVFRAQYDTIAPRLIQEGIAAGDWRMVLIAQIGAGRPRPRTNDDATFRNLGTPGLNWLLQLESQAAPERQVALLRLVQLGSREPVWAGSQGRLAEALARELSPAQDRRTRAWAEQVFRTAFGGKRTLVNNPGPPLCS